MSDDLLIKTVPECDAHQNYNQSLTYSHGSIFYSRNGKCKVLNPQIANSGCGTSLVGPKTRQALRRKCFIPVKSLIAGPCIVIEDLCDSVRISCNCRSSPAPTPGTEIIFGETTTVGNETSKLMEIPLLNNSAVSIQLQILGVNEEGETVTFYVRKTLKNVGGNISVVPFTDQTMQFEITGTSFEFEPQSNTSSVIITVTGAPNNTINWTARAEAVISLF